MVQAILFDFDNTIANTKSIEAIRENRRYEDLTADTMAEVEIYREVPEMLQKLRAANVKLGLVTNSGRTYIDRVMHHLDLTTTFDTVVSYSDVGPLGAKPAPDGLLRALENIGVKASLEVLYVGDDNVDHEAAYKAGITPVMPAWATRSPVSIAPALEMNTDMVVEYVADPSGFKLFAERCAELRSAKFQRNELPFLPLDSEGNVVTVREDMVGFGLGRYFSKKSAATAWLHNNHPLSLEIASKDDAPAFVVPPHWVDMFAHVIRKAPEFVFKDRAPFDIVTVVPCKSGRDPRLERLLETISHQFSGESGSPFFIPDIFFFVQDAQSQKSLNRYQRSMESKRALHLNSAYAAELIGKRILVIDDVITTGSTISRTRQLALEAGASHVLAVAVAKTVSIAKEERSCPDCGRAMRVVSPKNSGPFWSCTGFRAAIRPCTHTEDLVSKTCPNCGRLMRIRTNSYTGKKFWGCLGYNATPQCNYSSEIDLSEMPS
jgi:HAD superfamily hydrolase (TIGR01549 family)